MKNIEFYRTPIGGIMVTDEAGTHELREGDRKFISAMISKIGEFYPEALSKLSELFQAKRHNVPHYEYCIVSRFIRCNWGRYDAVMDIDQFGNFNFEEVECPLRGECSAEGIICKPKFNSSLSDREIEIMREYYNGYSEPAIADKMCISIETVKTHKRNVFRRTGTSSQAEFFLYAKNNNLFNK